MARIDFALFANGSCYLSKESDLEGDKRVEGEGGSQDNLPVHHLTLACSEETDEEGDLEPAIDLLGVLHSLSYKEAQTPIEKLVGMIFAEGVQYGRKDALQPFLERASKRGL